jgi:AcrR family transcriptional regulator
MMPGMQPLSSRRPRQAALTDAVLSIVAERGLDHVSVREVASVAGVSIGTVQHYFPTKDDMLLAAFHQVVRRIRQRIRPICASPHVRDNLSAVLYQLLPLDEERAAESRIVLAFAARAATSPPLATVQQSILAEITDALAEAFSLAAGDHATTDHCRLAAQVTLAAVDGLALHAVSSLGWISASQLSTLIEFLLGALLPTNEAGRTITS